MHQGWLGFFRCDDLMLVVFLEKNVDVSFDSILKKIRQEFVGYYQTFLEITSNKIYLISSGFHRR